MKPNNLDTPDVVDPKHPYSQDRPLPAGITVREARDAYLSENGFSTAEYTAETFSLGLFGGRYTLTLPNPPSRRWAVALHDLHHVATGYGADFTGEGEIAIWELVGGCKTPIVYLLNGGAALAGCVVAPRRMLRAYSDAQSARALYRQKIVVDDLLELSVGELRERLGIPRDGLARDPRAVAPPRSGTAKRAG